MLGCFFCDCDIGIGQLFNKHVEHLIMSGTELSSGTTKTKKIYPRGCGHGRTHYKIITTVRDTWTKRHGNIKGTASNVTWESWGRRWYQSFVFKEERRLPSEEGGEEYLNEKTQRSYSADRGLCTVGPEQGDEVERQGWVGDQLAEVFVDQAKELVFCYVGNGDPPRGF